MKVLVTRPQLQAEATAARLRALGHQALVSPLLHISRLPWQPPAGRFDAVVVTSANALAAEIPAALRALPVHCVGKRTAEAAQAAGFTNVHCAGGGGGAAALFAALSDRGPARFLHLSGEAVADTEIPAPLDVVRVPVYRAERAALTGMAAAALRDEKVDITLVYSGRTLSQFARECDRHGIVRARQSIALLGHAAAEDRSGWRSLAQAERPSEEALFAAAHLLCEDGARKS